MKRLLASVAGFVLLLPVPAAHATLTVDQDSIGGQCSDQRSAAGVDASAPWCSIPQATRAAPDGSTVQIRAGAYPRTDIAGAGQMQRSDYVTLEPYPGEQPSIAGIRFANASYVRVKGLTLVGSDQPGLVPAAWLYMGSHHIDIVDNDISGEGVALQSSHHALIQGNYVHDLIRTCGVNPPDGFAFYLTGGNAATLPASDDIQVLDNRVEDSQQDALNMGNLSNVVVADNDLSTTATPRCGDHVDLAQIEGNGRGPYDFHDNVFHDGGQFILRNATGLSFTNNEILRMDGWMQLEADPGARIENNSWWDGNRVCTGCGSLLIRDYLPGDRFTQPPFNYTNHMDGTVISHNVMRLLGNDKVPASDYIENRNLYYGPRANSSGVQGEHSVFAAPLSVPGIGGFIPAAG